MAVPEVSSEPIFTTPENSMRRTVVPAEFVVVNVSALFWAFGPQFSM